MRVTRFVIFVLLGGLLTLGFVIDQGDRPVDQVDAAIRPAVPAAADATVTWYCPGGSGPEGIAEVGVELINASGEARQAIVTGLPGGRIEVAGSVVEIDLPPGERVFVAPAELAERAQYVGAVVEVDGPEVVVEQTTEGATGTDRSPCSTRTAPGWIVASGATRAEAEGERMVIMMLNPFPDDAVADIAFEADVGLDDLEGVVIPAGQVTAVDVTEEVTVAGRVSAIIDVIAGRISVSRIQTLSGPEVGRGLRVTGATPLGAPLWYLPMVDLREGRSEVVSVTNPDSERLAEVDIEIIPDPPGVDVDPIELTIRPGRTVAVDLSAEARLVDVDEAVVVVRSLDGLPVAADLATTVVSDAPVVSGASGLIGLDAAAYSWLVPLESLGGETESRVAVFNPSSVAIAVVEISVDGEVVRTEEIGPLRRLAVPAIELAPDRFVARIDSTAPVVVSRELVGLTSRSAATGVVIGEFVHFADLV